MNPPPPILLSSSAPILPKARGHSRSPSRSPTRPRITDDILSDLSPDSTLDSFTNASGALRASIEAASPAQRAFGIRAAIASKKIQEWVGELAGWPWPSHGGFGVPAAKRRRIDDEGREGRTLGGIPTLATTQRNGRAEDKVEDENYWGSLPAHDVMQYESRIEDISADMDDLNVEEIKSQVLNTHVLPGASPSNTSATAPAAYTRMDDFTAVITATVLKALPNLSKLMALMDTWSVRLLILRQTPLLQSALNDAEMALKSGWNALDSIPTPAGSAEDSTLSRENYNIVREVLQDKVTSLGQKLDSMLDALEGRQDTIPEVWLDRMEAIEQDYGEWAVIGDRKVRAGEWARDAARRKALKLPVIQEDDVSIDHSLEHQELKEELSEKTAIQLQEDEEEIQLPSSISENSTFVGEELSEKVTPQSHEVDHEAPPSVSIPEEFIAVEGESKSGVPIPEQAARNSTLLAANDQQSPFATIEHLSLGSPLSPLSSYSPFDGTRDIESSIPLETLTPEGSPLLHSIFDIPQHFPASGTANVPLPPTDLLDEINKTDVHQRHEFTPSMIRNVGPTADGAAQTKSIDDGGRSGVESPLSPTPAVPIFPLTNPIVETRFEQEHVAAEDQNDYTETPSKAPRFGHGLANLLRTSSLNSSSKLEPDSELIIPIQRMTSDVTENTVEKRDVQIPIVETTGDVAERKLPESASIFAELAPLNEAGHTDVSNSTQQIENSAPEEQNLHLSVLTKPTIPSSQLELSRQTHSRQISTSSTISGYSASDPSPEICEAAQEYFSPVISPIRQPLASGTETPTRRSFTESRSGEMTEERPEKPKPFKHPIELSSPMEIVDIVDTQPLSTFTLLSEIPAQRPSTAVQTFDRNQTPDLDAEPKSPTMDDKSYAEYEESPSLGLVRIYGEGDDYSPPSSPLPIPAMSNRRSLHVQVDPYDAESLSSESPLTPSDSSFLSNLDLSATPLPTLPTKVSDDQLQQQISEILESIPALIRLTSEPVSVSQSELRPTKQRSSLNANSNFRPKSRGSSRPQSRAATPSFTLAPVQSTRRPRIQPGTPEIKVYHLSRSTGEAPIKLFVRLVGERGERVMVRVGGGWADLGEYLKEYAAHHGRRPDPKGGKVEIQDLPGSRSVSSGSVASVSTVRNGYSGGNGNGRSSPIMRPGSSLERPGSGFSVRKTRRSNGAEDSPQGQGGYGNAYRSPSTPLPHRPTPSARQISTTSNYEILPSSESTYTPPARSSSRLSWTEEDSSLGLAGPKSRKVEISAENAAWVESMKEKVRLASAEKDREREKERRASSTTVAVPGEFSDMGRVGGTKRLFLKKSGSGG